MISYLKKDDDMPCVNITQMRGHEQNISSHNNRFLKFITKRGVTQKSQLMLQHRIIPITDHK